MFFFPTMQHFANWNSYTDCLILINNKIIYKDFVSSDSFLGMSYKLCKDYFAVTPTILFLFNVCIIYVGSSI